MDFGLDRSGICSGLIDLLATSGLKSAYVSMVASRGTPILPGERDPRACKNHFYAWAVPFVWVIPQDVVKRGAHISVAENARRISPSSVDPTVKNYLWGDMTAALFQALELGYDTTVLLDEQDQISKSPGFNVFAVIEGRVVTSKSGMLEGISRKTVIEICETLDIRCEGTDISKDDFLNAAGVFTATTAGGIVPVTRVDARILGNDVMGPLAAKILQTYWDWHARADLSLQVPYKNIT